MDYMAILKEGAEVIRKNYILAIPTVLATFLVAFVSLAVVTSPEAYPALALMGLFSMVVNFFAHGVTLAMAREVFEKGRTSLGTGFSVASGFFFHFFVAAVAISTIVSFGFALFVIPGLIAMFLMMFAFPSIIMRGNGPIEALQASFRLVRAYMSESLVLFVIMGVITVSLAIVNLSLIAIPVLGQFLNVIISGMAGGFFAVVLLRAYGILEKRKAVKESMSL